jgi:hypothetical protein
VTKPARTSDYAAALATLPASDRATVDGWLQVLGMEPDELAAVPPLRKLVCMIAALRLMADMGDIDGREARFNEAAAAFGVNGESLARSWYRWQKNAVRQFVSEPDRAA